jgi:hypothetical protein
MIDPSESGFHFWISSKRASTATTAISFASRHFSMELFRGINATDQESLACVTAEKATFDP